MQGADLACRSRADTARLHPIPPQQRAAILKDLPGKDFSGLLAAPDSAAVNAVRDGMLFNYNMFAYLDGAFVEKAVAHLRQGGNPRDLAKDGNRRT